MPSGAGQFIFKGDYMGSNTNTLDYFYPEENFITLCDFIDQSYGFIACKSRVLFHIFHKEFGNAISFKGFLEKIMERIQIINDGAEDRWVTIAHICYPGHADFQCIPLIFAFLNLSKATTQKI